VICITDSTGITLKNRIDDENHIRIGITQIALWVDGTRRGISDIGARFGKPWCEFTINELSDLLSDLDEIEFWAQHAQLAQSEKLS